MKEEIANQLRAAIRNSGLSANALGPLVEVKQQTISDFLRGKDIRLATAQKLADYFGLVLKRSRSQK